MTRHGIERADFALFRQALLPRVKEMASAEVIRSSLAALRDPLSRLPPFLLSRLYRALPITLPAFKSVSLSSRRHPIAKPQS